MMLIETSLRNSSIEGVGLFATQFIPSGTIIWKLDERFDLLFPEHVVAGFPAGMREYFTRYGYPHMERDGFIVIELDHGRFMNHSEFPNTNFTRPDIGWTIADIQEGQEITCNYYEFDRTFRGFGAGVSGIPATSGISASGLAAT
jgi:SET domain-containing protein